MAKRRVLSEDEKRRKELVRELLKVSPIKDGEDLNSMMKEIIGEMVGGVLEGELDDELGYDRYDIKNKKSTNSRNGYGNKKLQTSYGDTEINVPRDREGDYDPELIKKYQKSVDKELEKKIISIVLIP